MTMTQRWQRNGHLPKNPNQGTTCCRNMQQPRKPTTPQHQQAGKENKSLLPCLPPQNTVNPAAILRVRTAKPTNQPERLLTPQKTATHTSILRVPKANTTEKTILTLAARSSNSQTEDYSNTNHSNGSTTHLSSILTAASCERSEGAGWGIPAILTKATKSEDLPTKIKTGRKKNTIFSSVQEHPINLTLRSCPSSCFLHPDQCRLNPLT